LSPRDGELNTRFSNVLELALQILLGEELDQTMLIFLVLGEIS
jgi:hypothetical protein